MSEELHLVKWRDCTCDWITSYCDESHARYSFVPRSVLEASGTVPESSPVERNAGE